MKHLYMDTGKTAFSFFAIAAFFVLVFAPRADAAFGISPPSLNADHMVAGAKYIQTVYLVQSDPTSDLRIKANLEILPSVRSWITIDKGFDFIIPKGVHQFPVVITVEVPKDQTVGSYGGTISFTTAPDSAGQVTIALGAQVSINIVIGTNTYRKFTVPIIKPLDIEEGWNPRVYVKFNNEGNVPEIFTGATFELLDQYGGTRLAFVQKTTDFPEVPPFTVGENTIEFPINFHLGIGQYWSVVNFYQNDKVVASQRAVFQVLKAGSISGPSAQFINNVRNYWVYYVVGFVILLFGYLLRRKKRRS